jgi:hypothetical protein
VSADVILSLMHFFPVIKGEFDICMVYWHLYGLRWLKERPQCSNLGTLVCLTHCDGDGSYTVTEMAPMVLSSYWCANNDYGEMFLNFPIHMKTSRNIVVWICLIYLTTRWILKKVWGLAFGLEMPWDCNPVHMPLCKVPCRWNRWC